MQSEPIFFIHNYGKHSWAITLRTPTEQYTKKYVTKRKVWNWKKLLNKNMDTKSHQIEFVNLIQYPIKNTFDQVESQPYTEEYMFIKQ